MADGERFRIEGVGQEVGILDVTGKKFAAFHGKDAADLRRRLDYAVGRLNSGEDTTTGYVWDKVPQTGA